MAGNLNISQINGGHLGFRNVLINGQVNTGNEINQRVLGFSDVSDGEYFADRWKRIDSSNITQLVEEGSYAPGAVYTLSGVGVTTTQVTAPASGTWNWGTVPSSSSLVQLEIGVNATPFEYRPVSLELSMCKRYYETSLVDISEAAAVALGTVQNNGRVFRTTCGDGLGQHTFNHYFEVEKRTGAPSFRIYNYKTMTINQCYGYAGYNGNLACTVFNGLAYGKYQTLQTYAYRANLAAALGYHFAAEDEL